MTNPFSWRNLAGSPPAQVTYAECEELQRLCKTLPNNAILVQIGAERGTSTLAIVEARPDIIIYSIDSAQCEGEFTNLKRAGYNDHKVARVLGNSHEICLSWGVMCDMLFIDGDHSYKGVKSDIEGWTPFLKSGGILAFHDYIPEPIPLSVKGRVVYAVDEWRAQNLSWERISCVERLIAFAKP